MSLKLFIESYGCQMNVLDSQLIAGRMKSESGYELTEDEGQADVVLFNTCSVREHAEDRALSNAGKLKKLKRDRPDVVVGIVGCMAQNRQDRLFEQLPHVQLVVGPRQLAAIPRDGSSRSTRRRAKAGPRCPGRTGCRIPWYSPGPRRPARAAAPSRSAAGWATTPRNSRAGDSG